MTFGQTVKKLRKAKKITQLELAQKIGVDFTYISKIENDKTKMPPAEKTIKKLAEILETDAEELILLAKKVPQNLRETIVDDELAVDFLRVVSSFNILQRRAIRNIISETEMAH